MHQIVIIFAQMLEIVTLSDLALVLSSRKFLFVSQGGIYPPNDPILAKMA